MKRKSNFMFKLRYTVILIFIALTTLGQRPGYYNGTNGKKGEELKSYLHNIIKGHVDFSYSQAKFLINYSDADPKNEDNVILFYTQRSQNADTYASGGDGINREHVWAKSHGDFADIRPMDGDAFNLRPADGSVNIDRSNRDFGNVQPKGTQHSEATECWYSNTYWEPGPATKGQVARALFYMSTRYEGDDGELDLEVVKGGNTYPKPQHGDLAALLEWNREYPPSDFERRRNERLFTIQQNRNPFIDHPEWADLIWADETINLIQFDEFEMTPQFPNSGETISLSFKITSDLTLDKTVFYWGHEYDSEEEVVNLDPGNINPDIQFQLTGFNDGDMVYYKIVASSGTIENTVRGTFEVPNAISADQLSSIMQIQGTGNESPMNRQIVTFSGRVVANFDNTVYVQSGNDSYSGICVYGSLETGQVGDSVVLTGEVVEFNDLTEISNVSYFYNFKEKKVVAPRVITVEEIGEEYEGMLITIKNAIFSKAGETIPDENISYNFSDDTGNSSIFIRYASRLLNEKIPYGVTDITGIVSQYQDTYQILPGSISDFSSGLDTIAPKVAKVVILDKDWMTVEFDERVEKTSSENTANYILNHNISVFSSYRYQEGNTVILNVAGMSKGTHTLVVNGVKDESGNMMDDFTFEFSSDVTGVETVFQNEVGLFPNPVSDGLLTLNSKRTISAYTISDLSGKVLLKEKVGQNETNLQMELSPGIYLLNVLLSNQYNVTQKLIIQ